MSHGCHSDKHYYHGYVSFYESLFTGRAIQAIAEIGVYKGDSIRWLLGRFPTASIYGADILPYQVTWPVDPRFNFTQLDQGDRGHLSEFMNAQHYDVIIDDGSHDPVHQIMALVEGVRALHPGGLYILEDIHTSHPRYGIAGRREPLFRAIRGFVRDILRRDVDLTLNALSFLLALEHAIRLNAVHVLLQDHEVTRTTLFSYEEIQMLAESVSEVHVYRRCTLPERCYRCGGTDYKYAQYECKCGISLYSEADSMSIAVVRR